MTRSVSLAGIVLCFAGMLHPSAKAHGQDVAFFEKKIRPVLVKHCYRCHSAQAVREGRLKGGLQLDTRQGLRQGGDSGPALVPGKPEESLLLAALKYEDYEMPPSGKLPQRVLDDFKQWIAKGANDPRTGTPLQIESIDLAKARRFWSLTPVRRPTPPMRSETAPIDAFVFALLDAENLRPTPLASPNTLMRRLYFDLIGLPPAPQEVRDFVRQYNSADDPQLVVERLVDGLLASPHFGERWGRHWLDVVRFAESNGRARNMVWHHAWRYRDYVIDAFNADMPFDRFVREQLAGDLLTANSREQRDRQIVATGLLALGPKSLEERNRKLFVMDTIDEQIDVISRGFLGLSVSCARCHDHKFDPIPTRDYYALAGILLSTDTQYGLGPKGIKGVNDATLAAIGENVARAEKAAKHLERVKEQTQTRNSARSSRYRIVRNVASAKLQLGKPKVDVKKLQADIATMEKQIAEWDAKIEQMDADLQHLVENPPPQPDYTMAVREPAKPTNARIHIRGEVTNLGEVVPRGVLQVLALPGVPPLAANASGRRHLAEWIASPHNPLTPRVAVNRVWQHLFGRGLVATPDDFGVNGTRPSHPKLLDYLASRFVERGWSMKKLIREMVLSRTYQRSSEVIAANDDVDPENVLLWRMRPRRLDVEVYRDAVLAVSGQLERSPRRGSVISEFDVFKQDEFNSRTDLTQEQMALPNRSIYLPVVRGKLPEMFALFDFADPNALIGKRDETSVPAQALFLMNSPWILDQARRTAERLLTLDGLDDVQRVERLYELALARSPSSLERERALAYVDHADEQAHLEAWTHLCQSVLVSLEFRFLK